MKLAKVKVEYTGGTTITERVMLDPETGLVHLPPRLHALLEVMDETECSPSFVLEYNGFTLAVTVDSSGSRKIAIPGQQSGFRQVLKPTKDQRQQNARFMHTLSAASIGGFVGFVHASTAFDLPTVVGAVSLAVVGVLLWYAGFLNMKGD
ncbi:hypothetical protein OKW43_006671 [Paraburkholderia sp. WC7.3g]|uniref:hypothetical protein n=1 Tax=Paraburkholderia sp. WC7.3g TaxID=2991070 RepID=UPI003D1B2AA8